MKELRRMQQLSDASLFTIERGEGYPVFVIHGTALDHSQFGPYLDDLAQDFRLIFVDLRGNGQSSPMPADQLSIEGHAKDIHELAGVMGLQEYAIYGHSYGAFIALRFAIDFPSSATHIIISAGCPSRALLLEGADNFYAAIEADKAAGTSSLLDWENGNSEEEKSRTDHAVSADPRTKEYLEVLPFYFHDRTDPKIMEYLQIMKNIKFTFDNIEMFYQEPIGFDYCNDLDGISDLVLILAGESDILCAPKNSIFMHEKIKGSEVVVFKESGHFMFAEQTEAHNNTVRKFLSDRDVHS